MFLGTQKTGIHGISYAIPRERRVLAAIALFIAAAGLTPSAGFALRRNAAQALNGPMAPHSATVASNR
jgi:hypothetical protein